MLAASLGLLFRPVVPPPFVAYAGLWLVNLSHKVWIDPNQLIFWGIAVVLLMLINFAKPDRAASATAAAYPSAGAIAGAYWGIPAAVRRRSAWRSGFLSHATRSRRRKISYFQVFCLPLCRRASRGGHCLHRRIARTDDFIA